MNIQPARCSGPGQSALVGTFAVAFRRDTHSIIMALLAVVLTVSCATKKREDVAAWPDAEVYMLPQEGGFQRETLELKDGRFRYWFSSDVMLPSPPKYPGQGSYELKEDLLVLSSGKTYVVRSLKGLRSLWRPAAVDYWDQHEIIDVYGILLPVGSIKSRKPILRPLFTKEQWERSAERVKHLEQRK
jgi:hypothetical protein